MDVFDLVAKIRLDASEYENGVGKARGTFSTLASGVGKGLATVAKVGAAAVTAGVAGVTALTKMGIEGYAQYEQLVGGVETLFKDSSDTVMQYAENAYRTAGMSANQYMENATSFSASLIGSLGGDTAKAAEVANMAIIDMSDNANKMGTDIGMIQNAYNGFAKGNFTMLDNLKLGYGGTREEMQRLLDDATAISGIEYDISSFADVAEAIHVVQTEMGIAGTTAREAASTIEGSISMMKGAWSNLVVGMADENANMEVLINNFVESTATAAQNLLPRIEQTLIGIGDLITALAPVIAEALPQLVANVLPSLLAAGVNLVVALVEGVVTALPALGAALLEGVSIILVEVFGVSEEKAGEFADSVNSFFAKIGEGWQNLVASAQTEGTFLNNVWTGLQETAQVFCDFCVALWDALSAAFAWVVGQIQTEGTTLNTVWNNIKAVAEFVWSTIKTVIETVIEQIKNIFSLFTAILQGDWSSAWETIKNISSTTGEALRSIISSAFTAIGNIISNIWTNIKTTISNAWNNIKTNVSSAIANVKTSISSGLNNAFSTVSTVLGNIKAKFTSIWDGCKTIVSNAISAIKGFFNFEWSLPHIKLPHFSVSGGEAPWGFGGKGSLPSVGVSWYRKAYDNAMVLSKPTIFGYSNGSFLGGGDGNGNEIVSGESHLMGIIGHVVQSTTAEQNEQIVSLLSAILEATASGNAETVRAIMSDRTFAVGEREFARLVRNYA